jgi:hypothetical protein
MMAGMITLILTGLLRGLRTRSALVLENLAVRHQLAVLQRTARSPRLRPSDREERDRKLEAARARRAAQREQARARITPVHSGHHWDSTSR